MKRVAPDGRVPSLRYGRRATLIPHRDMWSRMLSFFDEEQVWTVLRMEGLIPAMKGALADIAARLIA